MGGTMGLGLAAFLVVMVAGIAFSWRRADSASRRRATGAT